MEAHVHTADNYRSNIQIQLCLSRKPWSPSHTLPAQVTRGNGGSLMNSLSLVSVPLLVIQRKASLDPNENEWLVWAEGDVVTWTACQLCDWMSIHLGNSCSFSTTVYWVITMGNYWELGDNFKWAGNPFFPLPLQMKLCQFTIWKYRTS